MNEPENRTDARTDDILFEQLRRNKRRKRAKTTFLVIIILILAAALIAVGVAVLQKRVEENFARSSVEVLSAEARRGTISTVVSGSGTLSAVDTEEITVPRGVEIDEVIVHAGDSVKAGEVLATLRLPTVISAVAETQAELDELEDAIHDAEGDDSISYIHGGVTARIKAIYGHKGDEVLDVMTEHGALALLSLDGKMAFEVEIELAPGSSVSVRDEGLGEYTGTVESCVRGKSVVTVPDAVPRCGETLTVLDENGEALASGEAYIHDPLALTAYSGTIIGCGVYEGQMVYRLTVVFSLRNTKFSASYDALVRERQNTEETLRTLIAMMRSSTVTAPYDATVTSVDYEEEDFLATRETKLVTLAPDERISVSVDVDESSILSLSVGQEAEIVIPSLGEEKYPGTVTEIDRVGSSEGGVTSYTAVITLDKTEKMLPGMTADADIRIEGVESTILIPLDALHQTSGGAFVYTAYDAELRQYGGKRDITVGITNKDSAEVTSGLAEGETVYYTAKGAGDELLTGLAGGSGL